MGNNLEIAKVRFRLVEAAAQLAEVNNIEVEPLKCQRLARYTNC